MRTINQNDKFKIANRDGFSCKFCGAKRNYDELEIDHLIPISKHGSDKEQNLITSCKKCNRQKSNMVIFPESLIESVDLHDTNWLIHKSFGDWHIAIHIEIGAVLEYKNNGYWIGADRAHEKYWECHMQEKAWVTDKVFCDFVSALEYFRLMTK